jgi:hypothetical protein
MNEKIKELALQAGGSFYPDVNSKQLERFAELILKECIDICNQGTATQTTSSGAAILIKQRFEIKE